MQSNKAALRQFSKVLAPCPYCRNAEPKELVEVPRPQQFQLALYLVVSFLTCGIGFFFFPFFFTKQSSLMTYCHQCRNTFPSGL
jgi:LITAF-like zinc ribbon protein